MANGQQQQAQAQRAMTAEEMAAEVERKESALLLSILDKPVEYIPFGESAKMTLTAGQVRGFVAESKSGIKPDAKVIARFMKLCEARQLNPWAGDAYLVGYEDREGNVSWSLITAHQALLKRADAHPAFDGMESGVIVLRGDQVLEERGDFLLPKDQLLGGWARVYRKDRTHEYYDRLNLSVYNKGYARWKTDPAGMCVKCAEASVLREAFPLQVGGLYNAEEGGKRLNEDATEPAPPAPPAVPTTSAPPVAQAQADIGQRSRVKPRKEAPAAAPAAVKPATEPAPQIVAPAPPAPEPAPEPAPAPAHEPVQEQTASEASTQPPAESAAGSVDNDFEWSQRVEHFWARINEATSIPDVMAIQDEIAELGMPENFAAMLAGAAEKRKTNLRLAVRGRA
jgi:phage recombination protein Bet